MANESLSHPRSRERIIAVATSLVGEKAVRYTYGHPELGQSRDGFDCSGFARFVLTQAGFTVPDYIGMDGVRRPIRHSNEFWDHYGVMTGSPLAGDLIFFSRGGDRPTHVGIVRDGESYIHSPGVDGATVSVRGIKRSAIARREAGGRQLYVVNPIGYKAPTIPFTEPTYRFHQAVL